MSMPIHYWATCDVCDMVPIGSRYKCLHQDCHYYDLCATCEAHEPPVHDTTHPFVKLKGPDIVIPYILMAPYIFCDECYKTITDERYKCVHRDCSDFDLCAGCQASPKKKHPVTHPLLHLVTITPHATCDGCYDTIKGIRYKCLHEDCPDFDLCASCEASTDILHPNTHPLIKLGSPDISIESLWTTAPVPTNLGQSHHMGKSQNADQECPTGIDIENQELKKTLVAMENKLEEVERERDAYKHQVQAIQDQLRISIQTLEKYV